MKLLNNVALIKHEKIVSSKEERGIFTLVLFTSTIIFFAISIEIGEFISSFF